MNAKKTEKPEEVVEETKETPAESASTAQPTTATTTTGPAPEKPAEDSHHAGEIWKHGKGYRGITPNGILVRFPSKSIVKNKDKTITVDASLSFSDGGKTWSGTIKDGQWLGG